MRREGDTPTEERYLLIEGRASAEALTIAAYGLPSKLPATSVVSFITFAYADLPLGKSFTHVFRPSNKMEHEVTNCSILAVTQQFAKPLDEIPHGWKTITAIDFSEGIPTILRDLPVVDAWYENKKPLALSNEETWLRLVESEMRDGGS